MKVRVRQVESLLHELDAVQHRIAARAHEFFERRGGEIGHAFDDWVRAEHEVAGRPPVEVVERDRDIVVAFAVPGVDPADLDVRVSDDEVVMTAPRRLAHLAPAEGTTVHASEFPAGELARRVTLPGRVVPGSARADCRHGILTVTAAKAEVTSRRLDVTDAAAAIPLDRLDEEC